MGINALLPLLAPVQKRRHMTEFKGKRVAIDGYVWLHRVAFRYSMELAKDPSTNLMLPVLMSRINSLKRAGVIPIVVFDGQSLPSKRATNEKRSKDRNEALQMAQRLEQYGRISEAISYYQKAIQIKSATVWTWCKELQRNGIEYIVSPYEADAQLAYLARTHYVDCVITEDSDLIAYRTPMTLYKFDDNLNVISIEYDDVLQHLNLTPDQFTALCIFAGCDYIQHIGHMGVKTAQKLLLQFQTPEGVIAAALNDPHFQVPDGFLDDFNRAMTTFKCARAYDPRSQSLTFLDTPPSPVPDFLGAALAPDLLKDLIKGRIDTRTLEPLELAKASAVSQYFPQADSQSPEPIGLFGTPNTSPALPRNGSSPRLSRSGSPASIGVRGHDVVAKARPAPSRSKFFKAVGMEDPRRPQPRITSYFQLDPASKK